MITLIDAECCPQVLAAPLAEDEAERLAGALSMQEYSDLLVSSGFIDIGIDLTDEMADQIFGANVRATKS